MASVEIHWDGNEGFDIHVLKGETSPSLLDLLVIQDNSSPPNLVFASKVPLPADVDKITFTPNFISAVVPPKNSGIEVDTGTGAVKVDAARPAAPRLSNFVIEATVTTKPPNAKTLGPIPIRVYVHDAITDFWLTPNPLTLRQNANDQQLTVLAQFEDLTVGDISRRPGITWASADATKISFASASSGKMTAKAITAPIDITATIGGVSRKAKVEVVQPWTTPVAAKLVAGSAGIAKMATTPNILFLPDGFTAAEKPKFEALVNSIVSQIQSNASLTPFKLIKGSINYFMAFVPSTDRGTSVLYDMDLQRRGTKLFGAEIPDPVKPSPPTPYTLANLIWEVGLPTPADAAIGPGAARVNWLTQYGPGISAGFANPVYADWQKLSDHRLANERNTAFGFCNGQRPTMDRNTVARAVGFHRFRTRSEQLTDFFQNLRFKTTTGPMIGTIWAQQNAAGTVPAPSDPKLPAGLKVGQDLGRIFILLGGARYGGVQITEAIASSLNYSEEVQLTEVAGTKQVNLVPYSLPSTPSIEIVSRIAHETCHAFGLDDEYGEFEAPLRIPTTSEPNLKSQGNVIPASLVAKSAADPSLDSTKFNSIKWLWPRLNAAGVVDSISPGMLTTDIKLKSGHGKQFKALDVVRLRKRPLVDNPTPSVRMVVSGVTGDIVTVLFTAITPADFPAGSVLIRPVRGAATAADPLGPDLPLIAPVILNHLGTSKLPLNLAPPAVGAPITVCIKDEHTKQDPKNLPAAALLKPGHPPFKSMIVGLYDGGSRYFCGVYHPSGVCLMRARMVPGFKFLTYLLCPVCRYVIVDRFDPTKHAAIDKDYEKRYPQP